MTKNLEGAALGDAGLEELGIAKGSVMIQSEPIFKNATRVVGLDHNKYSSNKETDATKLTIEEFVESMYTTGFQATNFALAVNIINEMVSITIVRGYL